MRERVALKKGYCFPWLQDQIFQRSALWIPAGSTTFAKALRNDGTTSSKSPLWGRSGLCSSQSSFSGSCGSFSIGWWNGLWFKTTSFRRSSASQNNSATSLHSNTVRHRPSQRWVRIRKQEINWSRKTTTKTPRFPVPNSTPFSKFSTLNNLSSPFFHFTYLSSFTSH